MSSIHENMKKHKCDFCEKEFHQANTLKDHIASVHEGKKPVLSYDCEKCGKYFLKKSHLVDHINIVHEKNYNHKCDLCEKAFCRPGKLKAHIESVHGILGI